MTIIIILTILIWISFCKQCKVNNDCIDDENNVDRVCLINDLNEKINGICCIKLNHQGCKYNDDCCFKTSICDQKNGICRKGNRNLNDVFGADNGYMMNEELIISDDNNHQTHYRISLIIIGSIILINFMCYFLHKYNKKIFFISKNQIQRFKEEQDSHDDDDNGYLNESVFGISANIIANNTDNDDNDDQDDNDMNDGENFHENEYEIEDISSS